MTAPIRDMAGLVRGLRHAVEERQITTENIDEIAGLPSRYTTKILAPNGGKSLGPLSFEGILGALGKCLVLVDDPEQIARVKNRWQRRKRIQSKAGALASRFSIDQSNAELQQFKEKLAKSERMKALGKIGGKKGGKRRMKTMGKRARQRIAAHAARARWDRVKARKSGRKRRSPTYHG